MPELDVHSAIGQGSERLLHRVTDNAQLAQMIMGIVSQIALIANERKKNLQGIRVGEVSMTERRMRAKVTFSDLTLRRAAPEIPQVNSFMHFLKAEAEGLYLMIARNPDILVWMQSIITHMEQYASQKGKQFSNLSFGDFKSPGDSAPAFIDKEDYIVLELDP